MTDPGGATREQQQWEMVDEGWGRRAAEFATLAEPTNVREYVTMHHRLGVGPGDRLLDVACGSGLALELAALRGATCAGIDASPRLLAVARDRSPEADLRVGDMNALPWDDESFDVVTSFRGIWGTTPDAVTEVFRVLAPGGRVGLTVWGHIKASPGAWALAPFALADEPKVQNQAAMVALGRPGAGEALLADIGFTDVERIDVPFVFEFADPEASARAMATAGPAYEAMQAVGEQAFMDYAVDVARSQVRPGLPLRGHVLVVGYLATKPGRPTVRRRRTPADAAESPQGFLSAPPDTPEARRLLDDDVKDVGYVMNVSRLWAHLPAVLDGLSDLMAETVDAGSITQRQRGVLVTAAASAMGDSYCSLAWGKRLAAAASPDIAASVIEGGSEGLDEVEQALARWARMVATDPNGVTADDVAALRAVGLEDSQILAVSAFIALRLAFSTVNDALGATPDRELRQSAPEQVRDAVTFGRLGGDAS